MWVSVDMSVRMHTYIHRERKRQRAVYVGSKGSRKLGLEVAKGHEKCVVVVPVPSGDRSISLEEPGLPGCTLSCVTRLTD